jgi:hypothetical protein
MTHALTSVAMSEHPSPQEAHWPEGAIFTLGHSTLPIERFMAWLQTYDIERLVDIRTMPRSRHNPQFNDTALNNSLTAQHLEYVHIQALGGLRRAHNDSPNTGWRNRGFRGYADYMQTEEFQDALEALIHMSRQNASRLCAPKRCRGDATVRWWLTRSVCAACRWSRFYRRAATGCISSHPSRR